MGAPAHAGDLKLTKAQIGYRAAESGKAVFLHGGIAAQSAWLPCELVLTNHGSTTYTGTLSLESGPFPEIDRRYRRHLTLAPHAKKRVRFSVLFEDSSWYRVHFEDEVRGQIKLAEADGRGSVNTPGLGIPSLRSLGEPLVLILRGQDSLATQLPGFQGKFVGRESGREWRALELEGVAALPDEVTALHRVSLLILDDVDLPSLSEAQQRALLAWVAAGGRLWISTLKSDTSGLLGSALPGAGTGRVVRERGLAELEPSLGTVPELGGANELRVFAPREGDVLWKAGAEAGILHRRHGRGWIVRAGFRVTRARFDKRILLRELLALHQEARTARLAPAKLLERLGSPLRGSTLKKMPQRHTVIGVVVAYVLLGVVLPFLAFRRNGRLELAWACVLLSTVLATGVVVALGKGSEQETRIVRVSLVEGGAQGPNLQASAFAVFSREGGLLPLEFKASVEGAIERAPLRRDTRHRPASASSSEGTRSYLLETDPQDTTLLGTQELVELPGWVRLVQTGPASARVERSDGWELKGAWAFDSDGHAFKSLEVPVELRTGPRHLDPVLDPAMKGVQEMARARAIEVGRPLLAFWWEGAPRLSEVPEFGLDVGLVQAAPGWGAWGKRRHQVVRYAAEISDAQGQRWPFYAPLPDPSRRPRLSVQSASRRFALWNFATRKLAIPRGYQGGKRYRGQGPEFSQRRTTPVEVESSLRLTPLGLVRGELWLPDRLQSETPDNSEVELHVSSSRGPRAKPGGSGD